MVLETMASVLFTSATRSTFVKRDQVDLSPQYPDAKQQLSPVGMLVTFLTLLIFAVALSAFRYTGWGVIGTLAYVEKEQPSSEIDIDGPPAYDDVAGEEADLPTRGLSERSTVITSGIRQALAHLRSIGGVRGYFRGFGCALSYHILTAIVSALVSRVFYLFLFGHLWILAELLAGLVASLVCIQISTAWTHIVISEPSPKSWTRRLPPFRRALTNLWAVTLVNEACVRIAILVPVAIAMALKLTDVNHNHVDAPGKLLGKIIAVTALGFVLFITLVIPSNMALSRAQASMLPEEDETIIAFDRSFDGKVEPAIVGGTGALSLVDAFKTITRASRVRVLRLFVKLAAVEITLDVLLMVTLTITVMTTKRDV